MDTNYSRTRNIKCFMFRTHREDTNEIEVSVLVAKAMYKANRRCAMKQNIFLHDAMLPNVMFRQIAIAFLHIWNEDPIIRFGHIRRQWATITIIRKKGKCWFIYFWNICFLIKTKNMRMVRLHHIYHMLVAK